VIAIEAGKVAYDCLMHNCSLFPSPTFAMHAALSSREESVFHEQYDDNLGASKVKRRKFIDAASTMDEVRTTTIDAVLRDLHLTQLDFIKIDCEGWEPYILQGASFTLMKYKPVLCVEVNPGHLRVAETSESELLNTIASLGYNWTPVDPKADARQYDILCFPKS
jgi:FkbM family methyltransferase